MGFVGGSAEIVAVSQSLCHRLEVNVLARLRRNSVNLGNRNPEFFRLCSAG
jgi:hypothetical protein